MITINPPVGRLLSGAGGIALLVAMFMPWASDRNGWELWTMSDLYFLMLVLCALGTAVSGGRFGFFRPDVSLAGLTDLLGVLGTTLLAWLLIFDFPEGASREAGAFVALVASFVIACGAGDFRVLRGEPLFARPTP